MDRRHPGGLRAAGGAPVQEGGLSIERPQTALVTGASRGFGRGIAEELSSRGWIVLGLVRAIPEQPLPIEYLLGDVTDPAVSDAIAVALEGRSLELLVNNAGVDGGSNLPDAVEPEIVAEMMAVHASGVVRVTRASLPALRAARSSLVVNVSSRLGSLTHAAQGRYRNLEQSIAYRMAKAAQNMYTLAAMEVLGDTTVAMCSVHPGRLRTEMAAPDADLDVGEAVRRLLSWLDSAEDVAGRFYSLDSESDLPW